MSPWWLVAACSDPEDDVVGGRLPLFQVGTASWYGEDFSGRATASGQAYDPDLLTAAHPSLGFGTAVWVSRIDAEASGDASVVVEVNDRGPYSGGRIIDLSRAAAEALDMVADGTATVELRILRCPPGAPCLR